MMKNNGYEPEIIPAHVDEEILIDMSCESAAMAMALKKAAYIAEQISTDESSDNNDDAVIIAADTIVVYGDEIMGKPVDQDDAYRMLSKLRNNYHQVMTGVAIIDTSKKLKICFCDTTSVYFKDYTDEELLAYVKTSEPYDKAGGYAIQGTFGKYIDHFEGDYDNVVGFPWYRVKEYL
ncbi:MAG: septum formation protein Maf [Firmicutes bacterium]|nr:septum formation protein Maf [Bacillota bacterium]